MIVLEQSKKNISCFSNINVIKNIIKTDIAINNLILFNLPELKFINGNLENFILVIIRNEELTIIGNKNLGCEYSGANNFIFSIYKIKEQINIELNVVGKPSK